MPVSSEYFDMAAAAFKKYYPDPTSLTTNGDAHVCPTYVATTASSEKPFILQFRTHERALVDQKTYEAIEKVLGNLVPSIKLLGEHEHDGVTYLVYEQSKLPGEPIARLVKKTDVLPAAAEGVGRLLAKCIIPGTRCGTERAQWFNKVVDELELVCASTDLVLEPFKPDFIKVRDAVIAGGLDELPLVVSNGDMNALNILATKDGEIGGVVDWDARAFEEQPLGMWLSLVMWIKCIPRIDCYEEYENTVEIGERFWRGFLLTIPREVAKQHEALLLAMKLGAILYEWRFGKDEGCLPSLTLRLRAELECTIPSLPDVEAALES